IGDQGYEANLAGVLRGMEDLVVVIHDKVDRAGHLYGAAAEYGKAILQANRVVEKLVAGLDLTRDAVVVTSDHGHLDRGGHGGGEPEVEQVPLVAAGAGIRPGRYADAQLTDVGPT